MTGSEKMPLLVVGKSQTPKDLRNLLHIPCHYLYGK